MAQKLADSFRAAGIEIATAEVLPSRLEAELRSGRRFDLAYRVLRCDEPVFDAGLLLCPGYDAPPEANALASTASPRSCSFSCSSSERRNGRRRGAWSSRSIASRATSCR